MCGARAKKIVCTLTVLLTINVEYFLPTVVMPTVVLPTVVLLKVMVPKKEKIPLLSELFRN
jgi:hypothetical protein